MDSQQRKQKQLKHVQALQIIKKINMHHFQIKTKSHNSRQHASRNSTKTIQIKIMAINVNNTKIMFLIKRVKEGVTNLVIITNKIVVMLIKEGNIVVVNIKTISRGTPTPMDS